MTFYLPSRYCSLLKFFLLVFILMFLNADSWFAPPFWDDIIGLHTQAVWLARNNFDLCALASAGHAPGSPLYNLFNPMAYIYAIAYRYTPPQFVHFLAHTINIAAISGCGVLFFNLLGTRPFQVKLLYLSAALSCPLTISACASKGQESLLAFLLFLSLFYKFKKCNFKAWLISIISWFFKLTGGLLTAGYIANTLLTNIKEKRFSFKTLCLSLFLITAVIIYYLWHFRHASVHFKWKPKEVFTLVSSAYWSLLPLFLSALIICRKRMTSGIRSLAAFIFLFFVANFLSAMVSLPRYGTIIVFPVLYLFAFAMRRFTLRSNLVAAGTITVVHLCNIYGTFLPEPQGLQIHDGSLLERSREFTIMRTQDKDFCAILEKNNDGRPLVCTWPMLQMLTVPEFGYVNKPMINIFAGEYPHPLGNFQKFQKENLKHNPLFLFVPDCYNWKIPRGAKVIFASNPDTPLEGFILYQLR